ncbi:MAG: DUF3147 family protein [Candidatus Cloacimonadales bacterium]
MYYFLKISISALLILLISEVAKRSSILGAILASVPLLSVLAIFWLYFETKDVEQIANLSQDIFWLVIPSLSFFIILPILLRAKVHFFPSMLISTTVMIIFYFGMLALLKLWGLK